MSFRKKQTNSKTPRGKSFSFLLLNLLRLWYSIKLSAKISANYRIYSRPITPSNIPRYVKHDFFSNKYHTDLLDCGANSNPLLAGIHCAIQYTHPSIVQLKHQSFFHTKFLVPCHNILDLFFFLS